MGVKPEEQEALLRLRAEFFDYDYDYDYEFNRRQKWFLICNRNFFNLLMFHEFVKVKGWMNKGKETSVEALKAKLVDSGGRFAQDFGFSRISGQILMHLYLTDGDASLDAIETALDLSKAAVSMACTQLESLGLIVRVRMPGDRKRYYRSAENLYQALTVGIAGFVRAEVQKLNVELEQATEGLEDMDADFLRRRVERLLKLSNRMDRTLGGPIMKVIARMAK